MLAALVAISFWTGTTAMAAPFSASCVLLSLFPHSPFSTPRAVTLSHLLCIGSGVVFVSLPTLLHIELPAPLLVLGAAWLALVLMAWCDAVHAPAAAHAVILALGGQQAGAYSASALAVAGAFAILALFNVKLRNKSGIHSW